jgi:hypothetical protein
MENAEWGKYYDLDLSLVHVAALDPDVYAAFPNDKAVNNALRSLMTEPDEPSQK